jgi:diaminopimelate epimerase
MRFAKYHALGNDYLVLEASIEVPAPAVLRRLCDRHLGIGADGVLFPGSPKGSGGFALRIFNPDGSEAEKSGNGLRIFARYLWDNRIVSDGPFQVFTAGGEVTCKVQDQGSTVAVDMGNVTFDSLAIPVVGPQREVIRETLVVLGTTLEYSAASVGNPHCVLIRDDISLSEVLRLGPAIETHKQFPNRTNVQFVRVLDRRNLKIEIWERGAGYTLASGSSSCAAAAVTYRLGLTDPAVTVHMPGGDLAISIDQEWRVHMVGPVVEVAKGTVAIECLRGAS